jgi:CBS domain-containing protein
VAPTTTVYDAIKALAEKNTGALLVLEGKRLAGIFSERDYTRKIFLKGKRSTEVLVHEVMSTKVAYVTPEATVEECMALMTDKRIRHLPVLTDEELAGIVSIGDVVKAVISEKDFIIQQLERYISGG